MISCSTEPDGSKTVSRDLTVCESMGEMAELVQKGRRAGMSKYEFLYADNLPFNNRALLITVVEYVYSEDIDWRPRFIGKEVTEKCQRNDNF